jgi:hypothetical protein
MLRELFEMLILSLSRINSVSCIPHVGHRICPWCWSIISFRHPHSQGVDFDTLYSGLSLPFMMAFSDVFNSVFILG